MRTNGLALNVDSIDAMKFRRGDISIHTFDNNILYLFKLDERYEIFIHGMIYSNNEDPYDFMKYDGSFAFIKFDDEIIFGRDQLGTKPLYYSSNKGLKIASDARVLDGAIAVEPGTIYRYDKVLTKEKIEPLLNKYEDSPVENIIGLLTTSIKKRTREGRCLIGLSGLDSIILAKIADAAQAMVCTKDSYDYHHAKNVSNHFDLDIILVDEEDIKRSLIRVKNIIPFRDPMNLSIGVTFDILARYAYQHQYTSIVLGQLADELFGGYARYTSIDKKYLNRVLYDEVMNAWKINFIRDELVTSQYVELLLPYTSLELVRYVLSLDADLKIRGRLRKVILRDVAKRLGIEELIREKKAVQFSSGIYKIVKRYIS